MAFFDKLKKKEDKQKKEEKPKEEKVVVKEDDPRWAVSKEEKVEKAEPVEKTKDKVEIKEKKESKNMAATTAAKPAAKSSSASKNKVWHITKRDEDGMWQIKAEGGTKATKLFKTKAEAEEYVRTLKSNNEGSRVVKHKKTGEFQKK